MPVSVYATATRAASAAATRIVNVLRDNPAVVVGLPTGHTPIPMYRALVRAYQAGRADFSRATTFNLDEFAGLGRDDAGSYRTFMESHLFDHVNLAPQRAHVIDGRASDWRQELERFERRIARAGGMDLIVLGIGQNGHLGFNEPADALPARSHRVALRQQSRRANATLFGGRWQDVPPYALSMGIGTILNARRTILLATGASKARIVARALTGPVTTKVPASLLQTHPNMMVVLDRDAASRL
ncbi:MAG: glucosamine-6-phosphate deaminase [Acidobacteria bacterium]|jgi:glucosamine-6-phosphate deaminase|nr:glucosamine-6-phosphate deaminase [Acidobacteriota bacterium]